MPLIERTSVGTATASASDAPITWYLDVNELGRANPIQYIDIALPERTVLGSVQGKVLSLTKPEITPYNLSSLGPTTPVQGEGPQILPGLQLMKVTNFFFQQWTFIGLAEAVVLFGTSEVQRLIGSIPLGTYASNSLFVSGGSSAEDQLTQVTRNRNLYRYPTDGSIHYISTVVRPGWRGQVPLFLQPVLVWYPYELTYEVTAYVLNDNTQSDVDEQVSAVVQDSVCRELYGYRPGKEEQSDFIETQKQAVRVGEYILWQAQMVVSPEFTVPFNPAIRRGHTIRVRNARKNIDILGIVKNVSHGIRIGDQSSGQQLAAVTQVQIRAAEYTFRSALGESDHDEVLDLRQLE